MVIESHNFPINMTICGDGNDKYQKNNKYHNNNFFIAHVDVFVQTIATMVCFSLFPSCKTKSHAISRRILTELQKSELVIESPFLNLCICLMTCTPQSHLRKRKEKQNNLFNGCLIIPQKKNSNVSYVFILTHSLGSESKEPNQWRIGRHLSLCHTV